MNQVNRGSPTEWLGETLCSFLIGLIPVQPTAEIISCQRGRIP